MRLVLLALVAILACGSDSDDPLAIDGSVPSGRTLDFISPETGTWALRDSINRDGWLVASTKLVARANRPEVARVEFSITGGAALGTVENGPDYELEVELHENEVVEFVAIAFDGSGEEIGSAVTRVNVGMPQLTCDQWMELYEITYTVGPELDGVPEPITATLPIGGIDYQFKTQDSPRTSLTMDCATARALAMTAPYLRERDVVKVIDIGVYSYRCIGGGAPPDCPNGLSQHALARAVDLHEFQTGSGVTYNVETDWIIDSGATCAGETENDKDAWLHELVCLLQGDGIWTIALTPNFDSAHRNHFHVDLTSGANLIRSAGGVDKYPLNQAH